MNCDKIFINSNENISQVLTMAAPTVGHIIKWMQYQMNAIDSHNYMRGLKFVPGST